MVGLQQSSPMMTSMHCHSSVPSHCTRLKQCPVIMSCRPFGRQSYGIYALRGGKESKVGLSLDSGLKAPRISSNRRHGQRMQIRMAVETEFPLPNLDKFLWDDMKLPDLTGTHALLRSYRVHIHDSPLSERMCVTWCMMDHQHSLTCWHVSTHSHFLVRTTRAAALAMLLSGFTREVQYYKGRSGPRQRRSNLGSSTLIVLLDGREDSIGNGRQLWHRVVLLHGAGQEGRQGLPHIPGS